MKYLVIVESPAKKEPIEKYLGKDYKVHASFGHIRDLPSKNGSVLPNRDFSMRYVICDKSGKHVDNIVNAAKKAEIIYLATDPDREGESIAWHIAEVLRERKIIKSPDSLKRITFNEITKKAVTEAIKNPRNIDQDLVNAQRARRALDYLVGFTLSPVLWRKLPGCKSAGRVQSVALKLVCEREDHIERFKSEEYWDIILGMLNPSKESFVARLTHANKEKLEKFSMVNEEQATIIVDALKGQKFLVTTVEKKQQKRTPPSPFITSSLQQEAARKLGFSAKETMQVAQRLYEGVDIGDETTGLITYMRTDGVTLSSEAVDAIRVFIESEFGNKYLPTKARIYKSKAKNAQEAHEAIRPTNIALTPEKLKEKLEKNHYKLYDLIWKRTIACQMENVLLDIVIVVLDSENENFTAKATGSAIAFDGFYKVYREGVDDEKDEESKILPILKEGQIIDVEYIKPQQHFTEAMPRYSEASLVKGLEELGIGRPSTYASILSVLQERKYVSLNKKRFIPEELGRLVTVFLAGFFEKYVQYDFTAKLENDLDEVAAGRVEWKELLNNFWQEFNQNISEVKKRDITEIIAYVEQELEYHLFRDKESSKNCPSCTNGKLSLKLGKFGAFFSCSNYPECVFKKNIAIDDKLEEKLGAEKIDTNNMILGKDSESGLDVYLKKGPYGWYLQLGEQISKSEKPKRVALAANISPQNINLDIAVKLISLPLNIGKYPKTDQDIIVGIGKYGPYPKYEGKFISIPKKIDPLYIKLEEAIEIINSENKKKKSASQEKI